MKLKAILFSFLFVATIQGETRAPADIYIAPNGTPPQIVLTRPHPEILDNLRNDIDGEIDPLEAILTRFREGEVSLYDTLESIRRHFGE